MRFLPIAAIAIAGTCQPSAQAAPVPASAIGTCLAADASWTKVALKHDAGWGFLLVEMKVGGKDSLFLLDTGAGVTALSESAAARLGLAVRETAESVRGVGGQTRKKAAAITGLTAGPIDLGVTEIGVLGLEPLARKKEWGGHVVDGILGSDLLERHKLVIDVAGATLHRPASGASLAPLAAAAGLQPLDFATTGKLPVVRAGIGGRIIPTVLDTGASALLLDAALCNELKLPSYASEVKLGGAGGRQSAGHAFVARMTLGPATFSNCGANMADLASFPREIRMLAGIDFMTTCGMVIDYGARKVHVRAGETAAQELGVPGPILGSKEALKAKVAKCRTVAEGRITTFTPQAELRNPQGERFRKVVFHYRLEQVLSGKGKPGDELQVAVAVPIDQAASDDLKARVMAGEFGLVFVEADGRIQDFSGSLMKCSAIRRAQLKGLQ